MKKLIVVMSHTLTEAQIQDAKNSLDVKEVIQLTGEVAQQCKSIPADWGISKIHQLAKKVIQKCIDLGATHISVTGEPALVNTCYLQTTRDLCIN